VRRCEAFVAAGRRAGVRLYPSRFGVRMFGAKIPDKSSPQEFWRWFVSRSRAITADTKRLGSRAASRRLIVDKLGKRLAAVNEHLVHEIGMYSPETVELIISADGCKAAFPAVVALVSARPPLNGFRITAFRPRKPFPAIDIYGQSIRGDAVTYRLDEADGFLDLYLRIEADLSDEQLRVVGFLMLDMALGEFDVETGLRKIAFTRNPFDGERPLSELTAAFDARRPLTVQ